MSDNVLDVSNLTITAGNTTIVRDISFSVSKGKVLGLIGESGAGKSTIGLASLGFTHNNMRVVRGKVELGGENLLAFPPRKLRKILGRQVSYVAQSAAAAFNPAFRIIDQVIESCLWHGLMSREQAMRRAVDLFKLLDLPNPATFGLRYPHQVSGGQLQRAMTAMALCPQPQLVVFDEPTTALDVVTQLEVLRAIKQAIAVHDTAAIYISHDLAVVAQVADDIMVLRNGETIEYGPVEQVFNAPQHEYTRQLFNAHRFSPTSPAPQDKCLLQVSHVYAGYDTSRDTVEDVSLEVERGETLAVIGESGSGKSTLTRIVSGLLPWRSGVISFAGQPLAPSYKNRPKHVLANIQLINQHPDMALNPRQKVATIVGRPLEFFFNMPADETTQRIRELMDWVELPYHLLERYPTELSGGQKQRLCIARALAAEPEIILCDEPTSALDSIIAKGVLDLLKRIQKDNHTSYLFLTHDLNVVRAIADRVAVMHRGKIVRYGKKDKVLSPPFDPYTGTLVSSVPQMRLGWLDTMIRN